MRLKKFYKKICKKLQFDAKELVGFDKTKVECYNCHKKGHFARECRSKGNQDSRRRDAGYTGYKAKDSGRRSGKQEEPKALVTLDGEGVDWTSHSEDEQENYALMAYSNSGSDTEREQLGDASIEIQAYTQALKKVEAQLKLLAEAEKEKEELKAKVEKWHNSSKNLNILLTSQMSVRDKVGLGYGNQMNKDMQKGMQAVPPPMRGIYIPSGPDVEIDESQFTYGPKQSKPSESDARSSDFNSCESNSSEETLKSMPEPVVNEPKVVSQPKVWSDAPIIEEYESDSDDDCVTTTSKEQETPSFAFVNTVKHVKIPRQTVKEQNTYCDFHEKRMAKQAELNKRMGKGTGQRENRPVWNNVQRVNHQNQFVPTAVLTRTGRIPVNTAKASSTNNVNTARHNFNSQTASTNAARKVNTVKPIVNNDVPHKALENKGIVDSGCSMHMTGNKAYLAEYQDYNSGPVAFGELQHFNLFSVSQMCDKKNKVLFTDTECLVLSLDFKLPDENQVLLRVPRQNNMYSFNLENIVPSGGLTCLIAKATVDESNKWHRRLGHVNFKNLNKLVKRNLVRGLPSKIFQNDHTCVACQKGKQHKASYKAKSVSSISQPLHLIHMNLFGPTSVRSINHNTYCLVITDDFSRDIIEFCGLKGIKREYNNAKTSQQNGVAERKNRTLVEAARTMLADSFLPNTFWAEAVSTACYVLNRVLVTKPQNKTPYELITGKIPIIIYIRPFRCHVAILNTIDHLGKFEEKYDEGFLVGYSLNSKTFRVYNLETKRVEENLHIKFLENKPNVAGKGPNWLFDLDYLIDSMNYQPVTTENNANKTAAEPAQEYFVLPLWSSYTSTVKSSEAKNGDEKPNEDTGLKINEKPKDQEDQAFLEELERLKRQEKEASDAAEAFRKEFAQCTEDLLLQAGAARATITNTINTVSTPISTASPSNVFSDGGPDLNNNDQDDSQIPALEDIYNNLSDGIFTNASYDDEGAVADFTNLVTIVNVSPIPTSRIHSIHPATQILRDPTSAVQTRSKVHKSSGAHAFIEPKKISQALEDEKKEIDYDEVFAPVARIEAIGVFLAFASYMGFIVYQMDVKSDFLYGTIDEEVYVSQPPGFVDPKFPKKVYKVVKALYGLHQAPKAWYATLSTFLLKSGYRRGTIDKTLFIKKDKNDIMLVQVYVDDIIFGSTKKSWCDDFEALMKSIFQMSSMGEFTFFLGLQVKQKEDGIFISQDKYVAEILKKFDFASVKIVSTPIKTQKPLTKDEKAVAMDVHLYRSMIGSLMYLTASRPNIMFAVYACSRFQVTPKTSHLHAVKRIFRYLKGKPKLGLWYPKVLSFDLKAYSDSDYGRANLDRKSTTGEAEYVAATNCCGQNPVFHSKTKQIEIRHHFIRDAYEKKLIQVLKIHTDDNVADLLTKAFDVTRINFLIVSIGMLNLLLHQLRGGQPNKRPLRYLSLVDLLIPDETAHKGLGDRMERAATTAFSLEVEQDSGNIN
ncbi:putative ribonuclease H-like domain-containing protein [Tanacetum coccineum]